MIWTRSISRVIFGGLVAFGAHLALAPWTVNGMRGVRLAYQSWADDRATADFMKSAANHETKITARADLLKTADLLRSWLAQNNIQLSFVLLPSRRCLADEEDRPLSKAPAGAKALIKTALALKERGFEVLLPLEELRRMISGGPAMVFRDHVHFNDAGGIAIAQLVRNKFCTGPLNETMLAGDSVAENIGAYFNRNTVPDKIRAYWKNGASNLIAFELPSAPPSELAGLKQIIWVLGDYYLLEKDKPTPFPQPGQNEDRRPEKASDEAVVVKLAEATAVPQNLAVKAPYPSALVTHKFRRKSGESFLGIIYTMKDRVMDESVRQWYQGEALQLEIVPWETAAATNKLLAREQILDDINDYNLPRYFISHWMHASTR